MIDSVYLSSVPFSHQSGQDEGSAGPEIGRHNWSGEKSLLSFDQGLTPVDFNIRTHSSEFADVNESVLKYGFSDHAPSIGNGHEGHELGLKICRKAGIGHGLDVNALDAVRPLYGNGVIPGVYVGTGQFQLFDE